MVPPVSVEQEKIVCFNQFLQQPLPSALRLCQEELYGETPFQEAEPPNDQGQESSRQPSGGHHVAVCQF